MTQTIKYPTGVWKNADGLYVKFPPASARDATVGVIADPGDPNQKMYIDLDWSNLPAHSADETTGVFAGGIPNNAIPSGALIISTTVSVDTAFAGSSAALVVGLVQYDGTEIDDNGLVTATDGAVANLTLGAAQAGSGALIGTKLAANGYPWLAVTGGDFTAGHALVTITYRVPTDEAVSHN